MTLQMADRTMAQPEGVFEDVLIKVGKFIFPVDFVVMDMEEDTQVPLIFGRLFMAIGDSLIDVKEGELTLRVGDEAVLFNLNKSLKRYECALNWEKCHFTVTEDTVLGHKISAAG